MYVACIVCTVILLIHPPSLAAFLTHSTPSFNYVLKVYLFLQEKRREYKYIVVVLFCVIMNVMRKSIETIASHSYFLTIYINLNTTLSVN